VILVTFDSTFMCFLIDVKFDGLHLEISIFLLTKSSNSALTFNKVLSYTSRFLLSLLHPPPRTMIYFLDFSINSLRTFLIFSSRTTGIGTSHLGSIKFLISKAYSHFGLQCCIYKRHFGPV
jgi:hypothetical protein